MTATLPDSNNDSKNKTTGGGSTRLWVLLCFLGICLVALYITCLTYVKPSEYGIMIRRLGPGAGVQNKIYETGLHVVLPFLETLHTLPKNLQTLELTDSPVKGSVYRDHTEKAAYIQTSDGFFVDVDVTMVYRIVDAYKVFTLVGPGNLYRENGIIPKAEPVLKRALGELTTEEFYNSPLRSEKVELAKTLLNKELNAKGLHVDHILVRYFRYSKEIQRNIEEKKLKDQLVFKNQAEANAAREAANLEKVIQEGRKTVDISLEKGKAYVATIEGKIDNYKRSKSSEADLLVQLAEAKKTRLRNQALQRAGAESLVGLEMAEVFEGLEVVILPSDGKQGVNPLDLNQNLKLFEVQP